MKILLLGEFSGFHTTLRDGLLTLGHDATVVGTGDGSKAIPVDWNIGSRRGGLAGTAERIVKAIGAVAGMPDVDVLQLINPHVFPRGGGLNDRLIQHLRRKAPRMFLSACGDDAYFVQKGIGKLRYNPIDEAVTLDLGLDRHPLTSTQDLRWNARLTDLVDGIIPVMYEYDVGYVDAPKRKPMIPLPINVDVVRQLPNVPNGPIVVMHGAGRPGFKGSRHILRAFELTERRHPGRFEFIHVANLPIAEYLKLMERVNVIVDQAYSYSCGMNALFAMAMGKIVLGGAESESLSLYGGSATPVRNILPDADQISEQLGLLLGEIDRFPIMGDESRRFVERHHHYRTVAQRYIETWLP